MKEINRNELILCYQIFVLYLEVPPLANFPNFILFSYLCLYQLQVLNIVPFFGKGYYNHPPVTYGNKYSANPISVKN